MTVFAEYGSYDALGLAGLVRAGEVHPRELLEAALERIERRDGRLNAVIEVFAESAQRRVEGPLAGPLAGVPFLIKDVIPCEGHRYSLGSRLLRDNLAERSHELVRRQEAAGLVIIGRTNMSELGLLPGTEPQLYGPTRNPWDLRRSPGGSSGGSAAAVAAGIVPLAHGNDGGGSLRIPASACGVFGLKPSRGRTPQESWEEPTGIVSEHGLSRSVRDSAALLDAVGGPRAGDRWWAPPPAGPYLEEVGRDPQPLRVAFTTSHFDGRPVHPDCAEAVHSAARLCEELGHHVEEARPAIDGEAFADAYVTLWCTIPGGLIATAGQHLARRPHLRPFVRHLGARRLVKTLSLLEMFRFGQGLFEPWTLELAELEARTSTGDLWVAWNTLREAAYEVGRFLEGYDLMLTPTLGEPPLRIGELPPTLGLAQARERLIPYVEFTPLCNSSGLPAMSVPLSWNEAGLPIGVHFVAPFGREDRLFRLAGQLERARPWADRRPPGFAA